MAAVPFVSDGPEGIFTRLPGRLALVAGVYALRKHGTILIARHPRLTEGHFRVGAET